MEYLTQEEVEFLKDRMTEQKDRILTTVDLNRKEKASSEVAADVLDVSSGESLKATEHRLRDREKYLLKKINKAFKKIKTGDYGYCGECDCEIGFPRLKARPVAELCIECKEQQERKEKTTADRRKRKSENEKSLYK